MRRIESCLGGFDCLGVKVEQGDWLVMTMLLLLLRVNS